METLLPAPKIDEIEFIQTPIGPARVLSYSASINGQPALFVKYKRVDFKPEDWPFTGDYVFKIIPKPNGKENTNAPH